MNQSFDQSGSNAPLNDTGAFAPFFKEARLLVVDDEESLRITTAAIFEKEGYIVDTASSGDEAIDLLANTEYDLVLTDLHMEGGDGLTVLNRIRQEAPLTISVVLTGFASVESAIAALQEGAYDYLIKPCDIETMKHTIRRGVEHRRLMLAEQKARADLQQLNLDLEQRIEQRTAELRRLNVELADANRAKDVFLATLSHELRTPLTPVVGWIKLLRSGTLDEKSVLQALDAIERNAWLQSRLIDDLLDTSRIATGKLHFEPKATDLNVSVKAAVDTVRTSAAARNIELTVSLHPASLIVMGEPVRLQQIAWNMVSNAIKFTDPGGKVTITTGLEGAQAHFTVADTGIGIAPEFLPHVFDRFRQADGSTSRRHGGLGLGLAIADALAKMHGGKLEAQSQGVGHGASFTLRVDLALGGKVAPEAVDQKVHSLQGLDVLIVEDSPDTLLLLSTIFRREGANVTTAASAAEALQSAVTKRPNIIVSDIGMPEVDGYQLLEQLRILPGLSDVPAIAISGYASEEDRERALAVGYLALVPKPVDLDALFTLIQDLKAPAI
ncbi:MAG TPA: response regulator [Pyrinomonadaceae bacterium]|jgi:signal transduction histidine kinase|nr:response regulator [Pyrinomonadaceae bacterium]